jgi:hypothetical protein
MRESLSAGAAENFSWEWVAISTNQHKMKQPGSYYSKLVGIAYNVPKEKKTAVQVAFLFGKRKV